MRPLPGFKVLPPKPVTRPTAASSAQGAPGFIPAVPRHGDSTVGADTRRGTAHDHITMGTEARFPTRSSLFPPFSGGSQHWGRRARGHPLAVSSPKPPPSPPKNTTTARTGTPARTEQGGLGQGLRAQGGGPGSRRGCRCRGCPRGDPTLRGRGDGAAGRVTSRRISRPTASGPPAWPRLCPSRSPGPGSGCC